MTTSTPGETESAAKTPTPKAEGFGLGLHIGLWIAAVLAATILRILGRSYRIRFVAGKEILDQLVREPRPVLLTFWHNNSFFVAYFTYRFLHRQGFPVTLLASHSRDGELVTRVGRLLGFEAVRGSASRGGRDALRRLYRVVTRKRSSPITIPDGPRGPIYKCKPGVVVLSQLSGAPFLPIGFHAERAWRLSSWDRLFIPKPFTRVSVAIGEPFAAPRELSESELAQEMRRVEATLNDLGVIASGGARADDATGR